MGLSRFEGLNCPLNEQQLANLEQLLGGFNATQLAWISGYIAGIGRTTEETVSRETPATALTILYGSQTGNARAVAEALAEQALTKRMPTQLRSAADYRPRDLGRERALLLVISTHGDGEPPDGARELHAWLHSQRAPRLEALRYAVLGLGDSSYAAFCRTARDFDERFAGLGAQRILPVRCCDLDYREAAQAWSKKALEEAAELLGPRIAEVVPLRAVRPGATPRPDQNHPYTATLLERRRLTTDDAHSDVRHLALSVDAKVLRYTPGDSIGVHFCNALGLVEQVLAAAGLSGDEPVELNGSTSPIGQALAERRELTRLHPSVVKTWARVSGRAALGDLITDPERLREYVATRQVIDLLLEYRACPGAQELVDLLLPLQPRLYSVASTQQEFEDEVHLTVSTVRYWDHGREHLGGASGYLAERVKEGGTLDVYVVENPAFRLPADGTRPIIMVGAGTGVAPFRAFLQQRAVEGARGEHWLVPGHRHFRRDFLYQLDWQSQRKAGLLTRVTPAFSRDGAERNYVQHRLLQESVACYRWLQEGAHLYVCGSLAMGRAVEAALVEVVASESKCGLEAAREHVEMLRGEGRYQRDLY